MTNNTPSPYELRAMLEDLIIKDLLGPADGPEEEMNERRVHERYVVGVLAPKKVRAETQDVIANAGTDSYDEGKTDLSAVQSDTMFPSSMGMTFAVDKNATELRLTARWGDYTKAYSQTLTDPKTGNALLVWKRTPVEGTSDPIPVRGGIMPPWVVTKDHPKVTVRGRMRKGENEWLITLFLVNGQEDPRQRNSEKWLFQPELIAESPNGKAIFRKHLSYSANLEKMDEITRTETRSLAMLYRRQVEFAVGHSTGVHAHPDPENPQRATRLETKAVPIYEVPQTTPPDSTDNPDLEGVILDMKELSEATDAQLAEKLIPLADAYQKWIEREAQKISDPAQDLETHEEAAGEAMANCQNALSRIREGISLLSQNKKAARSFRFANRAMWQQRVQSIFAKQIRKGQRKMNEGLKGIDIPQNRTWYPFQLAFILLNLPGVTDVHHHDRTHETQAAADLLWFPTGGGKTEAYLGLAAYTMALRRVQGDMGGRSGEHGVAVIMRYTLRLLTLQQFQRATALICACEVIRREEPQKWGEAPFRIGLWVGMRATPNTTHQAQEAIAHSRGDGRPGGIGTPAQLTSCPWCGTAIDSGKHIKVYSGMSTLSRTFIYCGDPLGRCPFTERTSPNEGIPALVVDEEIYRNPPSLLISTVDKFAQMPWKGAVQMLFGQVNARCPRHGFRSPEVNDRDSHPRRGSLPQVKSIPHIPLRPPDLIIQDELHLISGPLGSMVGLYETAVDELCSWRVDGEKVRPKLIASTATIRRAKSQVSQLFLRDVKVFPPHGTDITDNFFSLQREPGDDYPGRRYLGICAMGRRYPAATIRLYVAALAAAQKLYEDYDAAADPWMTLAGYFNSIRELGGTRRLVEDDISTRLRDADKRGLVKRRLLRLEELTSRKSSADIPAILDRLDIGFNKADEDKRMHRRKTAQKIDLPDPLDVVLATNMISVGVDVDRLGLMAVAGQPKSTAEYIQATSRVGRRWPGLVLMLYNWARPRDLSHYERFEHYHATFYQHVEALSVTPFAPRAMDRGLTGIMVSLIRLANDELNENSRAGDLTREHELLRNAMEAIIRRAEHVGDESVGKNAEKMLSERRNIWLRKIEDATMATLGYCEKRDGTDTIGLLKPPGRGGWDQFICLHSLRDVEPSIHLILKEPPSEDTV
ncbi:DISARM system helicase DrmA [Desulfobacterales bacterium HSG2]|nr:DISARM system helicase DrmA [Desulfobacterales bacterium HSG2]